MISGSSASLVLRSGANLALQFSVQGSLPSWSFETLMRCPKTPFDTVPYTGDQLAIYQYLSKQVDPSTGGDIRSKYDKNDYEYHNDFNTLYKRLEKVPPLANVSTADWTAVRDQVLSELYALDPVNGLSSDLQTLAGKLATQNDAALAATLQNVNASVAVTNTDPIGHYWLEQVLCGALWGLAAVPFPQWLLEGPLGAATQIGTSAMLSFSASMFGGWIATQQGATPPPTIAYSDWKAQVDQSFLDLSRQDDADIATIKGDLVLLPMIGPLLSGTPQNPYWQHNPQDIDAVATNALNPYKLQFYRTFVPMKFNVLIWTNPSQQSPYYLTPVFGPHPLQLRGWTVVDMKAPTNAYLMIGGNLYLLCVGTTVEGTVYYPSPDLTTDLFTTLGVPQADVFRGAADWAALERIAFDPHMKG